MRRSSPSRPVAAPPEVAPAPGDPIIPSKKLDCFANYDANGELASFRYENEDEFNGDDKGAMYLHDDLMLYMYGLKSAEELDSRNWHCIGAGESWEDATGGRSNGIQDGLNGRPGSRHEIIAPTNKIGRAHV